jgi:hypothetical protein
VAKPKRSKQPPDLVDRLCAAIEELTSERAARSYGVQWVAVHEVARRLGIEADTAELAVAEALAAHRIMGDGATRRILCACFAGWLNRSLAPKQRGWCGRRC